MDQRILNALSNHTDNYGVSFPCARTRAKIKPFLILENLLNQIFCQGYSTTFLNAHLCHLAAIPLIGSGKLPSFPIKKGGLVFIVDRLAHASIQINRGLMQQFGEIKRVEFSDQKKVEALLAICGQNQQSVCLVADSVGSMGGLANIKWFAKLANQYAAFLYLDDAHGTSVYGKNGCGYVLQQLNYRFHSRLILVASLAKAFGSVAGVLILPTKEDEILLKHYATPYIFGGPLCLPVIEAAITSAHIHLSDEITQLQKILSEKLKLFDSLNPNTINRYQGTPIRGFIIGDEHNAIQITQQLHQKGHAVTCALYPTVAKGKSLLRIALSTNHLDSDIRKLSRDINAIDHEIKSRKL